MIKVTCQLPDYSDPAQPEILVHSHWCDRNMVVLEVDGVRYTVSGEDLKSAIDNCRHNNWI